MSASDQNLELDENTGPIWSRISELRQFGGPPGEFWPRFAELSAGVIGAKSAVVTLCEMDPDKKARLRRIAEWPAEKTDQPSLSEFHRNWGKFAGRCAEEGSLVEMLSGQARGRTADYVVAAQLRVQESKTRCVAAFALLDVTEAEAEAVLSTLRLLADVPESYLVAQSIHQARRDVEKFATVMDLMVEVNAARRFLEAALAFANGIASRFRCDRVSVGWLKGGFIKMQAISRTEKFDRQMDAVQKLEAAMEECLDQDDEILWPEPEDAKVVARDHRIFSEDQKVAHLVSLPLREGEEPVAVFTCERNAEAFTDLEVRQFRLAGDHAARLLGDLQKNDRWFGARWAAASRQRLSGLVGAEHTWAKVFGLLGVMLFACLIFVKVPYRVEADFILRSDELAFLTTPFSGFIDEVHVRQGDVVTNGQVLASLSKSDLHLQESQELAELNRFQREVERTRAENRLSEMRVAQAQVDQSEARLALVRHRLQQADIEAPFDGVVVEGDLRERIGAPLDSGDALFRVARTDALYVEAKVNERDVHELFAKQTGEIAFVAQPDKAFAFTINRVESAAFPEEGGNFFVIRGELANAPDDWWRPGMSGIAKINTGDRRLIWIFTHRTVDFLRLWLWW